MDLCHNLPYKHYNFKYQCINVSTFNLSSHHHINTSSHHHINTSSHQQVTFFISNFDEVFTIMIFFKWLGEFK